MSISELEDEIRERINRRRKQHELLTRSGDWHKLCSALDVVGDTELALDAYLGHPVVEHIGLRYLFVYGALQLLQTQQDAVADLCEALRIKSKISPKLPRVREIRSSAVAHPTEHRENKASKSNFIQRISLSHHGFTLMTVYSDGRPYNLRAVSVPRLIKEQRGVLEAVLGEVLEKLDEEEMTHRKEHRDDKLSNVFPPVLGYYFQKIVEAAREPAYFPLGKMHVDLVSECLARFKSLLEKRGEWGIYDSVNYEYELLEYPLAELRGFFTDQRASKLNERDAYIFSRFVQEELRTLQQIAQEIDEEYSRVPVRAKRANRALKGPSRKRGAF